MKTNYLLPKYLLLGIAYLLFLGTTNAQMLREIPISTQMEHSSLVIEGKVVKKQSHWTLDKKSIYTINTVQVYKAFKGEPLTTLNVITLGGVIGLEAQTVSPSLQLSVGDVGVFMLLPENNSNFASASSIYKTYSDLQGFYKYNLHEAVAANPFKKYTKISDNFYTKLQQLSRQNYTKIKPFKTSVTANKTALAVSISGVSPLVASAGTKTVVTLTGNGFGTTKGKVGFKDANNGGASYYYALDNEILSWTDTQIEVEIPSRAGTGNIIVEHQSDGTSATSSENLNITFSQQTVNSSGNTYVTHLSNQNTSGGYTWQMHTDFNANTAAKEAFMRAFNVWRCDTSVYWDLGDTTTTDEAANDEINVIRFDNGNELPEGVLGVCTSYFNGCSVGDNLEWFVKGLDIVFNDTTNWNYATSNPNSNQYDFESVAAHELGHGHQLGHVIDNTKMMHFSIVNGEVKRTLSTEDKAGGDYIFQRSFTTGVCNQQSMIAFDCSTLSNNANYATQLSIHPNPVTSQFTINGVTPLSVSIFDVSGKLLQKHLATQTINMLAYKPGLYFVEIIDDHQNTLTKKIVVH